MNSSRRGFTIIETMLVLAITGLVAAVVLVSIGTSLRNEQYRSAVDQVYDYVQGQYSLSSTILNDSNNACSSAGLTNAAGQGRGTSDCFILGRVLKSTDGRVIESYPAIALRDVADPAEFPGEEKKPAQTVFADAKITEGTPRTTYDLGGDSGVSLIKPSGLSGQFTLLIVRSPITGRVHTYVSDIYQGAVQMSGLTEQEMKLCVNPNGLINSGITPSGIFIEKGATSSSSVRLLGSGECV